MPPRNAAVGRPLAAWSLGRFELAGVGGSPGRRKGSVAPPRGGGGQELYEEQGEPMSDSYCGSRRPFPIQLLMRHPRGGETSWKPLLALVPLPARVRTGRTITRTQAGPGVLRRVVDCMTPVGSGR